MLGGIRRQIYVAPSGIVLRANPIIGGARGLRCLRYASDGGARGLRCLRYAGDHLGGYTAFETRGRVRRNFETDGRKSAMCGFSEPYVRFRLVRKRHL